MPGILRPLLLRGHRGFDGPFPLRQSGDGGLENLQVHLPDNALQLAAYAGADWMIDGNGTVRETTFPSAAAVVRLDRAGGYEAGFLTREKLIEHHPLFTRLLDIKDFLGFANEA